MGHLDQFRKGTRSTQPRTPTSATLELLHHMPGLHIDNHMADAPQELLNARTNLIFTHIHAIDGVISSNQTGRFPITSSRGNKYLMVACELDGNYIDAEPIKSRKTKDIIDAYHLDPYTANIVKYALRFPYKAGRQDIEKLIHYAEKLHAVYDDVKEHYYAGA